MNYSVVNRMHQPGIMGGGKRQWLLPLYSHPELAKASNHVPQ